MNLELAILAAYGKIIPKKLLSIPKFGFINIHPSLLPKHRGSSPIESAILNGEKQTGVTIIQMDEKLDHGSIISQAKLSIAKTSTKASLTKKLAQLASQLLLTTLPAYFAHCQPNYSYLFGDARPQKGKAKFFLPPKPQNHQKATFTKILNREHGFINPQNLKKALQGKSKEKADQLERQIRAFTPWPGTWSWVIILDKKTRNTEFSACSVKAEGRFSVFNLKKRHPKRLKILKAHLKSGKLILDHVQLEGKKSVSFEEFKQGYPNFQLL